MQWRRWLEIKSKSSSLVAHYRNMFYFFSFQRRRWEKKSWAGKEREREGGKRHKEGMLVNASENRSFWWKYWLTWVITVISVLLAAHLVSISCCLAQQQKISERRRRQGDGDKGKRRFNQLLYTNYSRLGLRKRNGTDKQQECNKQQPQLLMLDSFGLFVLGKPIIIITTLETVRERGVCLYSSLYRRVLQ